MGTNLYLCTVCRFAEGRGDVAGLHLLSRLDGRFVKLRSKLSEGFGGVYIRQLLLRDFDREKPFGVAAYDAVAAVILRQREQLGVKHAREDARVAPLSVVRRADDMLRMLTPA